MTNRAEDRAKARGINNRLLQYKVVLYMHFLLDVFDQMSQLSLLFQRDDITVPSVVLKCEHVQLMLTSLLTVNGSYLESFYQHVNGAVFKGQTLRNVIQPEVFETDREIIINSLLQIMDRKFGNILGGTDIFKAAQIFDPRNWPDNRNDLTAFGREDLQTLLRHFEQVLANTNPPVNANDVNLQWEELKTLVQGNVNLKSLHPNSLWERFYLTDQERDEFASILKVIFLVETYPLSTACCERGFSTMKRIKNDWRCNLATPTLDTLMRVKIAGPQALRQYDPLPAVNRWWLTGERARRPTILPHGPHADQ
ncbi:zinc finger protein 862-like [Lingula anatina]|uniref:Zinc finger protein 862-like n=1 Tax=Lingula anatina TaxID=7574 RepID=A0A1S3HBX4_LINAN|nr:zinc finger protein 862-like [Lingula anatina]|eukprot:XP_013383016.1 zinc finger protein 862-like [Lingula anatina]